jgi:hypothetical protein
MERSKNSKMDFIESDSDDSAGGKKDAAEPVVSFTPEETEAAKQMIIELKAQGNEFFSASDHDNALLKYTVRKLHFYDGFTTAS